LPWGLRLGLFCRGPQPRSSPLWPSLPNRQLIFIPSASFRSSLFQHVLFRVPLGAEVPLPPLRELFARNRTGHFVLPPFRICRTSRRADTLSLITTPPFSYFPLIVNTLRLLCLPSYLAGIPPSGSYVIFHVPPFVFPIGEASYRSFSDTLRASIAMYRTALFHGHSVPTALPRRS